MEAAPKIKPESQWLPRSTVGLGVVREADSRVRGCPHVQSDRCMSETGSDGTLTKQTRTCAHGPRKS